jgi:hypothetical protein
MSSNSFETRKMFAEKIVNLSGLKGTELSDEYIRLVNLPVEELSKTLTKLEVDAALAADRAAQQIQDAKNEILCLRYSGPWLDGRAGTFSLRDVEANWTAIDRWGRDPLVLPLSSGISLTQWLWDIFRKHPNRVLELSWKEEPDKQKRSKLTATQQREQFKRDAIATGTSESEAGFQAWLRGDSLTIPASDEEQIDRRPWDFPGTVQYKKWLKDPARLPSELALAARREREAAHAVGPTTTVYGEREGNRDTVVTVPLAPLENVSAAQRDKNNAEGRGIQYKKLGPEITKQDIIRADKDQLRRWIKVEYGERQITERLQGIS